MKWSPISLLVVGIALLGLPSCSSPQHAERDGETDSELQSEYREALASDDARWMDFDAGGAREFESTKLEDLAAFETELLDCVEQRETSLDETGGHLVFRILVDTAKQPVALRLEDQSFRADQPSDCLENRLRDHWVADGEAPLGWHEITLVFVPEWHRRDDGIDWHYPEQQVGDVSEHIDRSETDEVDQFCDPSEVEATIEEHKDELAPCFEEHWSGDSTSTDAHFETFVVAFRLAPSFPPYRIGLAETSILDDDFEQCIADELHTWSFPDPVGGVCHIHYPLTAVGDEEATVSTTSPNFYIEI